MPIESAPVLRPGTGALPAARRFPVLLLLAVIAACGDATGVTQKPTIPLRAVAASARIGELATFVRPGGGLGAASYSGSLGSAKVEFAAMDDSTLAAVVPASLAPGIVSLVVDLGAVLGQASVEVAAGVPVENPVSEVEATLDAAVAGVRVPRPAEYGGTWSADSALIEREVAAARAAFGQLAPADRLEVARLFGSLGGDGAATAGQHDRVVLHSATASTLGGSPEDLACARELVAWDIDLSTGEKAAAVAVTWKSDPLKWIVARALALTRYIEGVLAMGGVANICTMEQDFAIDGAPTSDRLGTTVTVSADRRTFSDTDAETSFVARKFLNAKGKVGRLFDAVSGLFTGDEGKVSAPVEPKQSVVVRRQVPVESERITLGTSEITDPNGAPVPISLVRKGGQLIVQALGELRQTVRRSLSFTVERTDFPTQQVAADVEIRSVCLEEGQIFPGCVDRVVVEPAQREVGVGDYAVLTATLYDAAGDVLTGRSLRWYSDDEDILAVVTSSNGPDGYLKGMKAGGPITVTAVSGVGSSAREGTAKITVVAVDSTAIYKAAAAGHWTVTNGGDTYMLEMLPDGKGIYRTVPNEPPTTPCPWTVQVGDYCEYEVSWTLWKSADGRYRMRETGFWHPGFDGGEIDPLTMPITGFKTYSQYTPGTVTRIYTKR